MLKAPYIWFGGKSKVAPEIWNRFGDVEVYIEPFAGSIATLLARPTSHVNRREMINDLDGFVPNFWRAVQADPDLVAQYVDQPLFENDLHARNAWLEDRRSDLAAKLEGDPHFYDAKIAGWWVWILSASITGIFGNKGPWVVEDGKLVRSSPGSGIKRAIPACAYGHSRGILSVPDKVQMLHDLQDRIRETRVICGDWSRVVKTSIRNEYLTGILLDPPYGATEDASYDTNVYAGGVDSGLAAEVQKWCLENGSDPKLRIALCGYEGEHEALEAQGWIRYDWKTSGGMGRLGGGDTRGLENASRERIWFSPHCLKVTEHVAPSLFG